jgi:hypothetical protein
MAPVPREGDGAILMPEGVPSIAPPQHCLDDASLRLTDRDRFRPDTGANGRLSEGAGDSGEGRIELGTESSDNGDNGDRYACRQQTIFDSGRPFFIRV